MLGGSKVIDCKMLLFMILISALLISGGSTSERTYNLKIQPGIGGTIPAGYEEIINGKYKKGTKIKINARSNPGYCFENWTSCNGGTFTNINSSETLFIMPENDTTVTAHFALSK